MSIKKTYEVSVDYCFDVLNIEANSPKEAEQKAIELTEQNPQLAEISHVEAFLLEDSPLIKVK